MHLRKRCVCFERQAERGVTFCLSIKCPCLGLVNKLGYPKSPCVGGVVAQIGMIARVRAVAQIVMTGCKIDE